MLLLLSFTDIQVFSFISNAMQLLKELYFDLVNISAHLVLWASKVREYISKHPPGSSLLGRYTVLSISSVKPGWNLEMRPQTILWDNNSARLKWPFWVSLAWCAGMFSNIWCLAENRDTVLQMCKIKLQIYYLWCFFVMWHQCKNMFFQSRWIQRTSSFSLYSFLFL